MIEVMTTQSLAAVKAHFSQVIDEVAGTHERVTVTRNGSPVAVILAVEDYESLMETLEILSDMYGPSTDLYFLMGQDSLRDFASWREPGRIAELSHLGVALRPYVEVHIEDVEQAVPATRDRIHLVQVPLIEISSRDIRQRIANGGPYRFQLAHGVAG
jgi:prevent-host-death family protein